MIKMTIYYNEYNSYSAIVIVEKLDHNKYRMVFETYDQVVNTYMMRSLIKGHEKIGVA